MALFCRTHEARTPRGRKTFVAAPLVRRPYQIAGWRIGPVEARLRAIERVARLTKQRRAA